MSSLFYCIERTPTDRPFRYPGPAAVYWRRAVPGFPWTDNIDEAAQYGSREAAQTALEAENWHCDPSAPIRVTEHAYVGDSPTKATR